MAAGLDVLLLVNDNTLRNFMLAFLENCRVTVASTPGEVSRLLEAHRYALVIVTNFGVAPSEAVASIPHRRDYPGLFVTGNLDDSVEAACINKQVPWRRVPIAPEDLRREIQLALDDLRP